MFTRQPEHLELYKDASGDYIFFNLDEHCDPHEYCVGTVIPFKNDLFYDAHLDPHSYAGYEIGHCIVVADHPVLQFYCLFSVFIDHKGQIALQGYGTLSAEGSTFLITAAAGEYEAFKGSLDATPTDETNEKYFLKFEFLDEAL